MPTSDNGVDAAVRAAAAASREWAAKSPRSRAVALRAVADELDAAENELVPVARAESHLSEGRLTGELKRTTFQLRLFADQLDDGGFLDARIDRADPDWGMGPRPDIRRVKSAIGPVVVFAASNFPFAFSVAGGDTASALAAGCPVVLKAHPGHPELSEKTGSIVARALSEAGAPDGTFSLIFGDEAGRAALLHPLIRAGAFTGSIRAGRILFDVAAGRDEPIPFYGELGSVNPVFVTPGGAVDPDAVADGFIGSFTLGGGQFCTKPGLLFVPDDAGIGAAVQARLTADGPGASELLGEKIVAGYRTTLQRLMGRDEVTALVAGDDALADDPTPTVLTTTLEQFLVNVDELSGECFGPTGLIITYRDPADLAAVPAALEGQLTATVHADADEPIAGVLVDAMSERAGRVLWGGWPTGVTVTHAQQHGGPYPATTAPTTTSVGTAAIERFLRPVAYQNMPQTLLPEPVRDDNPWRVPQRVDGALPQR
ncbi:aldehyde dehydrogenase (NADP(+)) [Spelaeicoccus albus]